GSNNSYYAGRDAITGTGIEHSGGSKTQNKRDATATNAKFYLQNCEKIVSEISLVYPNMKFALVSTKRGTGNSSREYWNNTIYDELEKSDIYPNLYTKITALTQHHYVDDNYGNQTVVTDIATAKVAIAEGVSYPVDRTLDYEQVPSKYKIWFTEYGATKKNAETMWTTGMRSAALSLSWIDRGDKVGQLDYHYITDKNVVWPDEPSANVTMNLAPIGIASSMLALASADMTKMQKIIFTSNIEVVSGIKALQGYKFYNNDKETLIILNLTDEFIKGIDLDALFTYSGTRNRTTYWSNNPYETGVFENSKINLLENVVTDKLTGKKFSITVIEVIDDGLGIEVDYKSSLNVFPNPFKNSIEISNYIGNQTKVYSIEGRDLSKLVTIGNINKNTVINTSLLPKGIYILRTEFGSSIIHKQ
ncbi:MAG: T9SS type A sorting domain-containing protein, partial [Chlamydiia bacterium]|nr:T9SS type A sorting domain-containing protein [Chlamydiia bacterium]